MPSYGYRCTNCGFEEDNSYPLGTAPEIRCCSACGYIALRRVYTPIAVSFKGHGFYRTDNRTVRKSAKSTVGG